MALAGCWFVYFERSESEVFVGFTFSIWGCKTFIMWWLPTQIVLAILCYHLFLKRWRDLKFLVLLMLVSFMPFLFIGSELKYGGLNELWFKSRPAYMMLLAYYFACSWKSLPRLVVIAWVYCTLAWTYRYVIDFGKYDSRIVIRDTLNGHLYHPGYQFLQQSVPACKEPIINGIILREGGASERVFPGNLLPKARGCDYSRPLQLD